MRIGLLLPLSNGSSTTRALATAMMNSAQAALFDAHNPDLLLVVGDEGSSPQQAASAARTLLAQGAEIIVGPLFATSVSAVAPIARDHGVPVISFSTDRGVGGDGVYLLSYQPEAEVHRVVSYASAHGLKNLTALVPRTPYGERVGSAVRSEAKTDGVTVRALIQFDPRATEFSQTVNAAKSSGADTILIAQGGPQLSAIGNTIGEPHPQLLGTGLWAQSSTSREAALQGGWFAAPPPRADARFEERYRGLYGTSPPQLAPLAYDAISLVAALASGQPYNRFTEAALTDPDGFSGVSGIFRFRPDGSCDRGLAILSVGSSGFQVVDPAPRSFQQPSS